MTGVDDVLPDYQYTEPDHRFGIGRRKKHRNLAARQIPVSESFVH
jgi:hypothetical protein